MQRFDLPLQLFQVDLAVHIALVDCQGFGTGLKAFKSDRREGFLYIGGSFRKLFSADLKGYRHKQLSSYSTNFHL